MTSITAEHLNLLILRHLIESGFTTAASNLESEAEISRIDIVGDHVPDGALLQLGQKGIQRLEQEADLTQDDVVMDGVQLLQPFDLIKKSAVELQRIVGEKKDKYRGKRKSENVQEKQKKKVKFDDPPLPCEFPNTDITVLQGHSSEVIACAWNPDQSLLASGSQDSTAIIWKIDGPSIPNFILQHQKAVTSLEWDVDGTLLATGSDSGQGSIWRQDGKLVGTLDRHTDAIYSLKWNKTCDYLLSGSHDRTAVVWDATSCKVIRQYEVHAAPILDVDWRKDNSFASCSSDGMIHICKLRSNRQFKSFAEHKGPINTVKWDPTGKLLASCSDDCTAKIWRLTKSTCFFDMKEHSDEVYTIRWSPSGPQTNNPNQPLLLATASFDSTIKLWDIDAQRFLISLDAHRSLVHCIAFSPNGEYLASGSTDKRMYVWSLKECQIVRTYIASSGVSDVSWNKEGNKIAIGLKHGAVGVLDFRM